MAFYPRATHRGPPTNEGINGREVSGKEKEDDMGGRNRSLKDSVQVSDGDGRNSKCGSSCSVRVAPTAWNETVYALQDQDDRRVLEISTASD